MIDRQGGKLIFECDCCDEVFESQSDEFAEAWAAAKRDGWRSLKVNEEWLHSCGAPRCRL